MKARELNYCKGKIGEDMAKNYLMNKGYKYIESNYSVDFGEIDLIMSFNGWLVFVEVKYKTDDVMGKPEDMINKRKLSQVKRVAEIYLVNNRKYLRIYTKYRIDIICILKNDIKHYENIYV